MKKINKNQAENPCIIGFVLIAAVLAPMVFIFGMGMKYSSTPQYEMPVAGKTVVLDTIVKPTLDTIYVKELNNK